MKAGYIRGCLFGLVPLSLSLFGQSEPPALLWTFDAPALIRSSPAVTEDGTVYFGASGTLYAVTNRGSNAWTFPTGSRVDGSPAVDTDGTIYYEADALYAVDPRGSLKWRYESGGGAGSPAIGFDGTVYVSGGSFLHAVGAGGALRWRYGLPWGPATRALSPAVMGERVYLAWFDSRTVYSLASGGMLSWSAAIAGTPGDSPALASDGTIYATGGPLYAISQSGSNIWSSVTNDFSTASPVIGKDGTVYCSTSGSSLCAFTPGGELKWQVLSNSYTFYGTSPAVDAAGTIHFAAFSVLYAINPSGSILWSLALLRDPSDMNGSSKTSPAIGPDGTIYVTSANRLYAIAGTNGPADSPWPMYRQNARHTGKIQKPSLAPPKKRADANIDLQLFGQLGGTFTIEGSTNLNTWTSLTSFVATTVPMDVVDTQATNSPFKFYRAFGPP